MWTAIGSLLTSVASALLVRGGNEDLAEVLSVGAALLRSGADDPGEIRRIAEDLRTRVAEGRGYTETELDELRARRVQLTARADAAAEARDLPTSEDQATEGGSDG